MLHRIARKSTWSSGVAYGVSYATPAGRPFTALLASDDGVRFRALVPQWLGAGYPTEAVLRFGENAVMYCLQRRDGAAPGRRRAAAVVV